MVTLERAQSHLKVWVVAMAMAFGSGVWAQDAAPGKVAINGYDPVAYFTQGKPVPGKADFQVSRNGATYYFATAADRVAFISNPDAYTPQYDGYCAVGAAYGEKRPGDPEQWAIVGGKLYLTEDKTWLASFKSDAPRYIKDADAIWARIKTGG